jgi:hypothetical protein
MNVDKLVEKNGGNDERVNDNYPGLEKKSKAEITTPEKIVESLPVPKTEEYKPEVKQDPMLPAAAPAVVEDKKNESENDQAEKKVEADSSDQVDQKGMEVKAEAEKVEEKKDSEGDGAKLAEEASRPCFCASDFHTLSIPGL